MARYSCKEISQVSGSLTSRPIYFNLCVTVSTLTAHLFKYPCDLNELSFQKCLARINSRA